MAQWMQCNWIQQSPTWADSVCSLHPDTHDGFDEDVRKRARDDEKAFKGASERLRETIARAYDPEHGKVAEEIQALAAPYVERLESGAPRIDYAALERNKAGMREILSFQDAMRAEYEARMASEDDDDVLLLTWS